MIHGYDGHLAGLRSRIEDVESASDPKTIKALTADLAAANKRIAALEAAKAPAE